MTEIQLQMKLKLLFKDSECPMV